MYIEVVAESGCNEPRGFGIAWQRGFSLIELIMFIVIISVAETRMRITPAPINLSGKRQ
jgi:prepilin-type N-terminal cleavage/methylation domain-containing protein